MLYEETPKNTYQGDGVTTVFPYTFTIDAAKNIRVTVYDTKTDTSTEIEKDYIVDENAHEVHYPAWRSGEEPAEDIRPQTLQTGKTITIYRHTSIEQLTDYGDKYPLPAIEKAIDRVVMNVQELEEKVSRSLTVELGDGRTGKEVLDDLRSIRAESLGYAEQASLSATEAAASLEKIIVELERIREDVVQYDELKEEIRSTIEAAQNIKDEIARIEATREDVVKEAAEKADAAGRAGAAAELETLREEIKVLQRGHTYEVGDIAYSASLKSWQRLECVVGGTTSSSEPTMSTTGGVIVDSACTWLVVDVRDGTPVGSIRGSLYLPAGYVKANGATVLRADYPRLVTLADTYSLWTSDTSTNRGLFGVGDGSTTFVLPNWAGLFEQYANGDTGKYISAGLPNIEGTDQLGWYGVHSGIAANDASGTGAFKASKVSVSGTLGGASNGTATTTRGIAFNASLSNSIYGNSDTVQPPAIHMMPIMRY